MRAFNDFAEGLKNAAISVWPHLYLPLIWGRKEEKTISRPLLLRGGLLLSCGWLRSWRFYTSRDCDT